MTGYLLLPQSESGLYGLVDVGAGTTDVAFFWLQKDAQEMKAWYYAAGSKRIGMDDVDRAIQDVLLANNGNLRAAREQLGDGELARHSELIQPISKRIFLHHADVLGQARMIDQREVAWQSRGQAHYRLFLAGGGNATAAIRDRLSRGSPIAPRWDEVPANLTVPVTSGVVFADGNTSSLHAVQENGAARLLLLSYGLAHPRPDIPKYDRDRDGVKGREPCEAPVVEPPSGHWW
jgi:hypothetical protein